MSGAYANFKPQAAVSSSHPRPCVRHPLDETFTSSSVSPSTPTTTGRTTERGRQPSVRRREPSNSVRNGHASERISQVYDMAEGRRACLQRAAASPALWLVCQAVLVVMFALCCVFLTTIRPLGSNDRSATQAPTAHPRKVWMRLEFDLERPEVLNSSQWTPYTTMGEPYGRLVCSNNGTASNESEKHCDVMLKHFTVVQERNPARTFIKIKSGAVYRINVAVTLRSNSTVFQIGDTSVLINSERWITCLEGSGLQYVHCALFGLRYLPADSLVSFSSQKNYTEIAVRGASTFFEIERLSYSEI